MPIKEAEAEIDRWHNPGANAGIRCDWCVGHEDAARAILEKPAKEDAK